MHNKTLKLFSKDEIIIYDLYLAVREKYDDDDDESNYCNYGNENVVVNDKGSDDDANR